MSGFLQGKRVLARVSLDEGLDRTIDWIRHNLERYQPGKYEF